MRMQSKLCTKLVCVRLILSSSLAKKEQQEQHTLYGPAL